MTARLRTVRLEEVQVPGVRVTNTMEPEALEEFKRTIATMGVIEPLVCVETDGELLLVDGLNRLLTAREQGARTIQVAVIPGTLTDVLLLNLVTATARGKPRVGDLVAVVRALYREQEVPIEELVRRTGLSQEYIERLITVGDVGGAVVEELDLGRLSLPQAYLLARITDPDMRDLMLHQEMTYRWPTKLLAEHIQLTQEARQEASAATATQTPLLPVLPRCHYCGGEVAMVDARNPTICPGCDGLLYTTLKVATASPSDGGRP